MRVILIVICSIIACVSLKAQSDVAHTLFKKIGDRATLINDKAEGVYVRTGSFFQADQTHGLLVFPLEENNFQIEVYSRQPNESWSLLNKYNVEYGMLIDVKIADMNYDGLNDFIVQTVSGEQFDILFLTEKGEWHQSDYFNLGYRSLGEKYYYTYKAVGCADGAWRTDLISFSGKAVKEHASLYVENCSDLPYEVLLESVNEEVKTKVASDFIEEIDKDKLNLFWMSYIKADLKEIK